MSIAASGDGFTSSEDEGAVGLPPSGVVATAAPDPELTAMLARADVSIGWRSIDRPVPSPRGWTIGFLGADFFCFPPNCPGWPFFPEVRMRSWQVRGWPLSRPEAALRPPHVLTTLDGGSGQEVRGHSPGGWERSRLHLCPRNAATWRNVASPVQGL